MEWKLTMVSAWQGSVKFSMLSHQRKGQQADPTLNQLNTMEFLP